MATPPYLTITKLSPEYKDFGIILKDVDMRYINEQIVDGDEYRIDFYTYGEEVYLNILRRDYTTDNENGDNGIKDTIITGYTGTSNPASVTFIVEQPTNVYNYEYMLNAGYLGPRPTPTMTPGYCSITGLISQLIPPTPTPTQTPTMTSTPTLTPSSTPTNTPTMSNTPTLTPTITSTPTVTPTSVTPTPTPTPTATPMVIYEGKKLMAFSQDWNDGNVNGQWVVRFSTNSGTTWSNFSTATASSTGFISQDGRYIMFNDSGGSSYKYYFSSDYGATYSNSISGLTFSGSRSILAIDGSPNGRYIIVVASDNYTYISNNYGSSFTEIPGSSSYSWRNIVIPSNSFPMYAIDYVNNGKIYKITSETTYTPITGLTNIIGGDDGITSYPWASFVVSKNNKYMVARHDHTGVTMREDDKYLMISSDSGNTWNRCTTSFGYTDSNGPLAMNGTGQYVYFNVGNQIFISTDYGNNFTQILATDLTYTASMSISESGQVGFMIRYNPNSGCGNSYRTLKTTDYGANWTQVLYSSCSVSPFYSTRFITQNKTYTT